MNSSIFRVDIYGDAVSGAVSGRGGEAGADPLLRTGDAAARCGDEGASDRGGDLIDIYTYFAEIRIEIRVFYSDFLAQKMDSLNKSTF